MKENKKTKKIICITVLIVLVVFLIGNGVAYSKGKTNIFSWVLEKTKAKDNNVEAEPEKVSLNTYSSVLEKIGIQKEYDEIKTNVNQAVENNGVKVMLLDIACDENYLVFGLNIQQKDLINNLYSNIKKKGYFENEQTNIEQFQKETINNCFDINYKIEIEDKQKSISYGNQIENNNQIKEIYTITNCTLEQIIVYKIIDISGQNINQQYKCNINVSGAYLEFGQVQELVLNGNWKININKNLYRTTETKEYKNLADLSFNVEEEYGWTYGEDGKTKQKENEPMVKITEGEKGKISLEEICISKLGCTIKVNSNIEEGNMVDESIMRPYYAFEIKDSNEKIILNKTHIGDISTFFTSKMYENEEYVISVFKYYEKQIPEDDNHDISYNLIATSKFKLKGN